MESWTWVELGLAYLSVFLLMLSAGMKVYLNSQRMRFKNLQDKFLNLTEEIKLKNQLSKKSPFLYLNAELDLSKDLYEKHGGYASWSEMDLSQYEGSLAIPFRLAFLEAELNASPLRGSEDYWVVLNGHLDKAIRVFGKAFAAPRLSEAEMIPQEIPTVVQAEDQQGLDPEKLEALLKVEEELEERNKRILELEKVQVMLKELENRWANLEALENEIFPKIIEVNAENENQMETVVLLRELHGGFELMEGIFSEMPDMEKTHNVYPMLEEEKNVYFEEEEGKSDSQQAQEASSGHPLQVGIQQDDMKESHVEVLNNIINEQLQEIKELKSEIVTLEMKDDGQDELEESNRNLSLLQDRCDLLADEKTSLKNQMDQVQVEFEQLQRKSGSDLQEIHQLQQQLDLMVQESSAQEEESDFELREKMDAYVEVNSELKQRIYSVHQEVLQGESISVEIEKKYIALFEKYQALKFNMLDCT